MITGIGLLPLVAAMSLMASDKKMEPCTVAVAGEGWGIAFQSPPMARYAGRKNGKDFEFRAAGETGFNLSVFVEARRAPAIRTRPAISTIGPWLSGTR